LSAEALPTSPANKAAAFKKSSYPFGLGKGGRGGVRPTDKTSTASVASAKMTANENNSLRVFRGIADSQHGTTTGAVNGHHGQRHARSGSLQARRQPRLLGCGEEHKRHRVVAASSEVISLVITFPAFHEQKSKYEYRKQAHRNCQKHEPARDRHKIEQTTNIYSKNDARTRSALIQPASTETCDSACNGDTQNRRDRE
jgi:hypothetical protein